MKITRKREEARGEAREEAREWIARKRLAPKRGNRPSRRGAGAAGRHVGERARIAWLERAGARVYATLNA
eukprot:1942892-Pyramimonas_sp.AAC.1